MRFLVDTNLPPALATWLVTQGHEAQHTSDFGMEAAKDRSIWDHAKASGACIVTKDEDFVLLRASASDGPPIVWIRIGNALRKVLLARLAAVWPDVIAKIDDGENVIEIR